MLLRSSSSRQVRLCWSRSSRVCLRNLAVKPIPSRYRRRVVTGMKLTRPVPVYPLEARTKHISGSVVLDVVVGPDGQVHRARVISGPLELTDAAFTAALKTTYRPFMNTGAPAWFHSPVTFNINATP